MKIKSAEEGGPTELHVIRFREFVRLDAHGQLDMAESHEALSRLAQMCRKRGLERALLDGRDIHAQLTPDDIAALVRDLAEMGFTRNQRLALLHKGDPHRRAALFALIAKLRGWKIRAFGSFEEAVDWLSIGPDPRARPQACGEQIPLKTRKEGDGQTTAKHRNSENRIHL
jgi:hypothetical protein